MNTTIPFPRNNTGAPAKVSPPQRFDATSDMTKPPPNPQHHPALARTWRLKSWLMANTVRRMRRARVIGNTEDGDEEPGNCLVVRGQNSGAPDEAANDEM